MVLKIFWGSKYYKMRIKQKLSFLLNFLHVFMTAALEHSYQSMYNNIRASLVVCLNFYTVWTINSNIYLLPINFFKYTFQQIFYHFSISFKYYFFINSLFIFNLYLFFLYSFSTIIFFNKKCYIHNIFCNTFTRIITKYYMKSCY